MDRYDTTRGGSREQLRIQNARKPRMRCQHRTSRQINGENSRKEPRMWIHQKKNDCLREEELHFHCLHDFACVYSLLEAAKLPLVALSDRVPQSIGYRSSSGLL